MRRGLTTLVLLAIAATANAWTAAADQRIAMKAAQLAPNDLRDLIEKFEPEYKLGVTRAASEESDAHRFAPLRNRIERETNAIVSMIRTGRPMTEVVLHLGMLSHYVADANNPFHVANSDPNLEADHEDYEHYFESRLMKFPTVFYGLDPAFKLPSYLDAMFARTANFYPLIDEEYFRFGERHDSSEFDDLSTAFGVASVCYSRAVTDIVNLDFFIWRQAGGDVRTAPLLRGGNLVLNNAH